MLSVVCYEARKPAPEGPAFFVCADLSTTEEAMSSYPADLPKPANKDPFSDQDPVTRWCYIIFFVLMACIMGITVWMAAISFGL
jgi:hypothetical protein